MPAGQLAIQSVQSLYLVMQSGANDLGTGTGFVVLGADECPYLITNWHNLAGRRPMTGQPLSRTGATPDRVVVLHHVQHTDAQAGISWQARTELLHTSDGRPRWLEHPAKRRVIDVVALPLASLEQVELHPYQMQDQLGIGAGVSERVNIIGFPFGMTAGGAFAIWSAGDIASEPEVDFANLPLMLVDSRTRKGQSGSPVIIYRNGGMVTMENGDMSAFSGPVSKLLGVYSGRVNEQSDLGLVWKASVITEILSGRTVGNGDFDDPEAPSNPLDRLT